MITSPLASLRSTAQPVLLVLLVVAAVLALGAGVARAAGTPDLRLTGGAEPSVLYGDTVPVRLTASLPEGAVRGYNLAFRAVLPAGVTYIAGSAGERDGDPRILANAPTAGKTTLIWDNVDDLVASSGHTLELELRYADTGAATAPRFDVGDSLGVDFGAYISTNPRDEADFSTTGVPDGPKAGSFTGSATRSTVTDLTAIEVAKSEPHPEGEIPRGIHDHQTVYSLKVTNNRVNPTGTVSLEDYLPAGLEFLGCADTADRTTDAPTNRGSTEEYPGSGPIDVAQPTTDDGCLVPDLVETVELDPDGSGPLAHGVYTHVRWDALGDFAANGTKIIRYAAAIPLRENTLTWTGGDAPATTGAQAVNLDNNSGPETQDEQQLVNGAKVVGTYQAPAKPGKAVFDWDTLTRTAEDIAIQKSNDRASLEQGDLTKWTLNLQVSEYRSVDDVTIHDELPNGLCPLGTTNLEHAPPVALVECNPTAGKLPSAPYSSVTEQADGTWDMVWDKSTVPSLAHVKPSSTRTFTFWTRTRVHYQSNYADAAPIVSRDSVENKVDVTGIDWVRCVGESYDCAASGTKIDHDETDGEADTDVSGAGKQAGGPNLVKQVAAAYPASGDCNDLPAAAYGKTVPLYGPGDFVCWKLRIDFPANLHTYSQDVFDILPNTLEYVAGSAQTTGANSVPVGAIDTSSAGRLRWPIGDDSVVGRDTVDQGAKTFEVTFKSTVGSPTGHSSGDVEGNLLKFSYVNTAGTAFPLRDRTDFALKLPVLQLLKGVRQINGGTVNGPNADGKKVRANDVVQYRVDVTNAGSADASSSRVWDQLPTGITCAMVTNISDLGACDTLTRQVRWATLPIAVGASQTLTYSVTIPDGVAPDTTFVNTAGVVEYRYRGNSGVEYQLVPANDVVKDPALPTPNAPKAQDVSNVYTAAAAVVKTRTTSVTETGNNLGSQATVGETIKYTVTTTIPAGTTIYGTPKVVDTLGARQSFVPDTLSGTLDGVALTTRGVSVTEAGNTITATFPTSITNPTKDMVLVLKFDAKVLDVNANYRAQSLPNTATLTYKDSPEAGAKSVTKSGSVSTTIVEPKLSLAKSHTPSSRVTAGQIVDFTVKASNASSTNVSTAHDAIVVDTLPVGTDPVDASGAWVADGAAVPNSGGIWNATARTITWNANTTPALSSVAPGTSVDLKYRVKVLPDPIAGQIFVNDVAATVKSLDPSVGGVRTSAATSSTKADYAATAQDSLAVVLPTITKTVSPATVTIGDQVEWTVTAKLPANVRYFDATVVDTVPDGFDVDAYGTISCVSGCLGGDPAATAIPVAAGSAGALTTAWFIGDLGVSTQERVYTFVLKGHLRDVYRSGGAKVLAGTTLTNRASVKTNRSDKVSGTPTTAPTSFDDTVGPATAVNNVVEPKLTLTKRSDDADGHVEGGQRVGYTVTLKNTGSSPAYNVVITDRPDVELIDVELGTGAGSGSEYNKDGWTAGDPGMRWVIDGPIAVNETITLKYSGTVLAATSLTAGDKILNVAKITEYFGVVRGTRESNPDITYRTYAGPQDQVELTVAKPNLTISKTPDGATAVAGGTATFTVTVKNTDPHATAHGVVIDDLLPAGLSYAPGTATAVPSAGFSETSASGQSIAWKVTSLAPGASVVISVPVALAADLDAASVLVNTAKTHAVEVPDEKRDDGSLKVETKTDLQVTKVSDHDAVVPGTSIVYTMVVKNNGPSDARASTLTDTLPSYLRFVAVDDTAHCATTGQVLACDFGTLAPGATRTVKLTAKLDPARTTAIVNAVDVTTTTPETTLTNNHADAPNTVVPKVDVSITKAAGGAIFLGGQDVPYTLTVRNDGPSVARNVTVDDPLPSDVSFVSVAPSPECALVGGNVKCDFGTLAPGAEKVVTLLTKAKGTAPSPAAAGAVHKITVGKTEVYEQVAPGEVKTIELSCPNGGIASDGTVQIVDTTTGDPSFADVIVREARSIGLGVYRFVVENGTSGAVHVRPHVTCLPVDTDDHEHNLDVGSLRSGSRTALAPGRHEIIVPVGEGFRAVAPGIDVMSGRARLVSNEPHGNDWRFEVEVLEEADVTVSLRALSQYTAAGGNPLHVHKFKFTHVVETFTIPAGQRVRQLRVSCPVGYKGIVGTYDLPTGLVPLGSVPEPQVRDFDVLNTTDEALVATLDLECISIELDSPKVVVTVVNTATVATTSVDTDPSNDSDSATVSVERAPGPLVEDPGTGPGDGSGGNGSGGDGSNDAGGDGGNGAGGDGSGGNGSGGDGSNDAGGDGGNGSGGDGSGGNGSGGDGSGGNPEPTPFAAPRGPAETPDTPPDSPKFGALRVGTVSLSASATQATVPVTCATGSSRCRGTVTVRGSVPVAGRKGRTKRVVIGSAKYSVAPGQTAKVRVTVKRSYRALLKSGRVRTVTISSGKQRVSKKLKVARATRR